uniref:Uncharacterized protein n=1 Tax=Cacopsylla melanoneura TaxID=428564 RepID=A0A8D8U7W8_9HEMI
MTMAFLGIWSEPSSKYTDESRLFVKYCGLAYLARSEFQSFSSTEVLIHLVDRGFGCGIASSRYLRRSGAAGLMYLEWYAMLLTLTTLANTHLRVSTLTKLCTESLGPDSVQLVAELRHATSMSYGRYDFTVL